MTFDTDKLKEYSVELINPEVDDRRKYKILRFIHGQKLSIEQLQKSRIGKSVKKCTKIGGQISEVAQELIQRWGFMIEQYCENKKKLSSDNTSNNTSKDNHHRSEKLHKSHKSVKSETIIKKVKDPQITTSISEKETIENKDMKVFHDIINDGAMSLKAEELTRKRRSDVFALDFDQKRQRIAELSFIPSLLPELPQLNTDSEGEYQDASSIFNRFDLSDMNDESNYHTEDIDVTSKYSSERKVWVPKSKNSQQDAAESPEECEYINGVPLSEIASYNSKQLIEFEGDSRKVIRKTGPFWQKLFVKNYKCSSRFDDENWRDAYFRIEGEEEAKLKKISERLNKKTEINKQNESRAVLITLPTKAVRKFGSYRR